MLEIFEQIDIGVLTHEKDVSSLLVRAVVVILINFRDKSQLFAVRIKKFQLPDQGFELWTVISVIIDKQFSVPHFQILMYGRDLSQAYLWGTQAHGLKALAQNFNLANFSMMLFIVFPATLLFFNLVMPQANVFAKFFDDFLHIIRNWIMHHFAF